MSACPATGAALCLRLAEPWDFQSCTGTACGRAAAPSLKLATNSALRLKREAEICINRGEVRAGTANIDEMDEPFFRLMPQAASGRATHSAGYGEGQSEFVPSKLGAVL